MYTKKELESKSMVDLRKIGYPLGCRDNSKSELIAEIIKRQSGSKISKLIQKYEQHKGDVVETYNLRWETIELLKEMEGL